MSRSYDKYLFNFGTAKQFSKGYLFTFSQAIYESSICSTSSPILGILNLFNFSHPSRYILVPHYGFNLHFLLITNNVEHLFHVLIGYFYIFSKAFYFCPMLSLHFPLNVELKMIAYIENP